MFGSMNLYDNVAFPLREHTKKSESEIRSIVMEKMDLVGLIGAEDKLPGEISGGMRKRAGLARALVLDPEIVLFDEPDSGLDPVRTAFLNQLIIDLNAQIDATFLIVTHDVNTARTVPDNIGLLYHRHLAMFGPREMLLSSEEPVVRQFLNAQRVGPIGMSEEKDADELEAEKDEELPPLPPIPLQQEPSNGIPVAASARPGEWCKANGVTPPPGSFEENMSMAHRRLNVATLTASRALAPIGAAGSLFAFGLDVGRNLFRRPFQMREFLQQAWFIASVTIIPTALVAIPFGAVIALQVGGLIKQFGAQSFTGSASVLAVVQQAAPIGTALLIAGAGGSAIAADLGARKIREELDAMMVLGIDPIQRLVVPRVLACMLVAFFLNGMVSFVGVAGGYVFNVDPPGRHARRLPRELHRARPDPRPLIGLVKAIVFGLIAAIVASYKGMNAGGGPKGVGDAVNESVVITFLLLFIVNFVLSAIYLQSSHRRRVSDDMANLPTRSTSEPLNSLDTLGGQLSFYIGVVAAIPRSIKRYPKEILRILAEVTLGSRRAGRHRRHRRRHPRHDVLHRRPGRALRLRRAQPARHRRVRGLRLGLLQHPRDRAAGGRHRARGDGGLRLHRPARRDAHLRGGRRPRGDGDPSMPFLVATRVVGGLIAIIPLYVVGLLRPTSPAAWW